MRNDFKKQLQQSGYIHKRLKPDLSKTVEKRMFHKTVIKSKILWDGNDLSLWTKKGEGEIRLSEGGLCIEAPLRVEPKEEMEHYTGYGHFQAVISFKGENWEDYNRLTFRMKPEVHGVHAPYLGVHLKNDGKIKIPDQYNREGHHDINLNNHQWNACVWEFPDLPRDQITELSFSIFQAGNENGNHAVFLADICDIYLEKIKEPDVSLGWQGNRDTISFSTTGYFKNGKKTAVLHGDASEFSLIDSEGKQVFFGKVTPCENKKGKFGFVDFSDFCGTGEYKLNCEGIESAYFQIEEHVMEEAVWKVLNFIYAERCGCPVGDGHGSCHGDLVAEHGGLKLIYNGGWHDAGDVSQQTLQTGEVAEALFEMARRAKDEDMMLYNRLIEEASWGLDFILKTRFGDGFRAFSAGICRWTDNKIGDPDDETVRCHNRSFDNFLLAGIEAFAAGVLIEEDVDRAFTALTAAKEDYEFARKRFDEVGMEHCVQMEHTYNASLSQYYASMCWSAAQLYRSCGETYYGEQAKLYSEKLIACQETGDAGLSFDGFFYRDETKEHIVHFNHQSREHLFAQALLAVCEALKGTHDISVYEVALKRYGNYLKALYRYAAPYGMLPAGVHRYDEPQDKAAFELLHMGTTYEEDFDNYVKQLNSAHPIDEKHCIRQFPIWFSFRGNTAVMLSAGKSASICGHYFRDEELLEIGRDQLYWISGKNPFSQSLIYGEGSNYASQYAAQCGEVTGEIPVGIQTRENEDVPYWPMATNATYKEIWLTSAGHWLRLLADVY